jgi:hypothetical protein
LLPLFLSRIRDEKKCLDPDSGMKKNLGSGAGIENPGYATTMMSLEIILYNYEKLKKQRYQ